MRRGSRILLALALVVLIQASAIAIECYAQNPYYNWTRRTINPKAVNQTADPVYIVGLIADSIKCYLSNRSGYEQISTLYEKNTSMPEALQARVRSFILALNETYKHISSAEELVSEAKALVKTGDAEGAIGRLREAGVEIAKANITLQDLVREWSLLRKELSKYSSEDVKPILQEYYTLISKLVKTLRDLLNEITSLSLECYVKAKSKLASQLLGGTVNTTIIVYSYNRTIYPNSTILITGRVIESENRTGVEYGVVHLVLVYKYYILAVANTTLGKEGSFEIKTRASPVYPCAQKTMKPGLYKFEAEATLYYTPPAKSVFKGSFKNLNTTFEYIVPRLYVNGTRESMPGLNCTYSVKYPVDAGSSIILVKAFGLSLKYKLPPGGGNISLVTPVWVKPGFYVIEFTFLEHGKWYRSTVYYPVEIRLEDYIVDINNPRVIAYPIQKLVVKGVIRLLNGTPIEGALVSAGGACTESHGDGSFTLKAPVKPWFSPVVSLNVTVNTTRPWNPVKTYTITVHVINTPLLAASILLVAMVIAYPSPPRALTGGLETVTVEVRGRVKRSVEKGGGGVEVEERMPKADVYSEFMNLLARISPPLESETIREYFKRISKLKPEVRDTLARVQAAVEYALYSGAGFTGWVVDSIAKAKREVEEALGGAS